MPSRDAGRPSSPITIIIAIRSVTALRNPHHRSTPHRSVKHGCFGIDAMTREITPTPDITGIQSCTSSSKDHDLNRHRAGSAWQSRNGPAHSPRGAPGNKHPSWPKVLQICPARECQHRHAPATGFASPSTQSVRPPKHAAARTKRIGDPARNLLRARKKNRSRQPPCHSNGSPHRPFFMRFKGCAQFFQPSHPLRRNRTTSCRRETATAGLRLAKIEAAAPG